MTSTLSRLAHPSPGPHTNALEFLRDHLLQTCRHRIDCLVWVQGCLGVGVVALEPKGHQILRKNAKPKGQPAAKQDKNSSQHGSQVKRGSSNWVLDWFRVVWNGLRTAFWVGWGGFAVHKPPKSINTGHGHKTSPQKPFCAHCPCKPWRLHYSLWLQS